jgi:hypothetical protein
MQGNDSSGKVIYMSNIQGPEKVNDTCVETLLAGTMDRGFTVVSKLWDVKLKEIEVCKFLMMVQHLLNCSLVFYPSSRCY